MGEEGKGWEVTLSALANERSGISEINSLVQRLNKVKELARETPRYGRAASEDIVPGRQQARECSGFTRARSSRFTAPAIPATRPLSTVAESAILDRFRRAWPFASGMTPRTT